MKKLIQLTTLQIFLSGCVNTKSKTEKVDCKGMVYYNNVGMKRINFKITTFDGKVLYRTSDPFILYPISEKFVKIKSCKEVRV